MKVKFLMMPFAVIISIVMIIWHIWPTIFDEKSDDSIISLKNKITQEKKEIEAIKSRKSNIDSLAKSFSKQKDNTSLVFNYFPKNRREEDIISKINHIAFSSGVYINEVDFSYNALTKNDLDKKLAIPESISSTKISLENKKTPKNLLAKTKKTKNTGLSDMIELKVNVVGGYRQIKEFLKSLYLMGMLNNVELFNIEKSKNNDKKEESENKNTSKILMADITVNFGYKKERKISISNFMNIPLFKNRSFDFEAIDKYRSLVMEKYPNSELGEVEEKDLFYPDES